MCNLRGLRSAVEFCCNSFLKGIVSYTTHTGAFMPVWVFLFSPLTKSSISLNMKKLTAKSVRLVFRSALMLWLVLQGSMGLFGQANPCTAELYDFGGGAGNVVPCGPSANTTPFVDIQTGDPYDPMSDFNVNGSCGLPGDGGSPAVVYWVSFVIQEGGSFEWQTVPGSDKYYWELWASTDQVDMPGEESTQSGCGSLTYIDCGEEFTGWRVQSTPGAGNKWRFYLVYFLRDGDMEGKGVVKIRKSCGEACQGSDIAVTASDDVCILSGQSTQLSASASGGGGGPYTYLWTPSTGLNNPNISNPVASPTMTTTYTVQASGADNCPAYDEVTVEVGSCCEAEAGTVDGSPAGPYQTCSGNDLIVGGNQVVFSASGENAGIAYAFLLVNASTGALVAYNLNGNFSASDFGAVGNYTVYGLSFDEGLNGQMVEIYLGGVTNISEITGSMLCLYLVAGPSIEVVEPNCGNF